MIRLLFSAFISAVICAGLPGNAAAQFSMGSLYELRPEAEKQLQPQVSQQELYHHIHPVSKEDRTSELLEFSYSGGMSQSSALAGIAQEDARSSSSVLDTISESPGLAFLSSALVPGLGQAAHRQWWRVPLYAGIEIAALYVTIDQKNRGDRLQRDYDRYADEHWSVVQYAQAVARYTQLDITLEDMLTERGLEELRNNGYLRPAFDNEIDWRMIDLAALNDVEERTLYRSTGRAFSHVVPAYGSQQYYELVSKYFQYGPGWRDWNRDISIIDGGVEDMPASWRYHTALEEDFNDALRVSRNMGMLLIANHFFSAFDALFTARIRQHRRQVESTASLGPGGNPHLRVTVGL